MKTRIRFVCEHDGMEYLGQVTYTCHARDRADERNWEGTISMIGNRLADILCEEGALAEVLFDETMIGEVFLVEDEGVGYGIAVEHSLEASRDEFRIITFHPQLKRGDGERVIRYATDGTISHGIWDNRSHELKEVMA